MSEPALEVSTPAIASKGVWTKFLVVALKLAVASTILAWLVSSGQLALSRLWTVPNGTALAALIACKVIATTLPVVRWYVMARGLGLDLSFRRAIHIGLIGNFFNAAAPGMLGQDATKIVYGRTLELGSGARLLSTVLADRIAGVATLAGLGVALGSWHLAVAGIVPIGRLALLGVFVVLLAALFVSVIARLDLSTVRESMWRPLGALVAAMGEYRHHSGTLAAAIALSVAGHLAAFAALYFGFLSLGANPALLPVLALSPVLTLLRGIPTTPMGLGVLDWLGEILYSTIDLSDGAEVVMLTRLVTLGIAAGCGVFFLFPVKSGGGDDAQ